MIYNTPVSEVINNMKEQIKKILNNHYYKYLHKEKYRNMLNNFLFFFLWKLVYKIYSIKKVNEKLILFVANRDDKIPAEYKGIFEHAENCGYKPICLCMPKVRSKTFYINEIRKINFDLQFTKYYAQAKCTFVNDYYLPAFANDPRKSSKLIQVWHGCGAFKKWGYSTVDLEWGADRKSLEEYPIHNTYTYVTVSSEKVKKFYAEAFNCDERIIHADGVPRTDKYFDENYVSSAKEKILEKYPEIGERKIILYSPTFRGSSKKKANFVNMIDFLYLKSKLSDDYVILVKLHPFIRKGMNLSQNLKEIYSDFVFDISRSVPIDDAMCASDMVITDYSSLIFEYALLSRPMLFFAYDLQQYDRERSFYFDYENFVPGDIVKNTEEIYLAIRKNEKTFDKEKVEKFRTEFMSACDGKSTSRIINIIRKGKDN